jgi:4-hydroxy-tetrahydrodipicolinate reductase
MGSEVTRAIHEAEDIDLAAAVDTAAEGEDAGQLAGIGPLGVTILANLEEAIKEHRPDVMVDFTVPACALQNIRIALENGVRPVVGTTGLTSEDLEKIREWTAKAGISAFIAPNFAIGAVLMMQFAERAARYMPDVEIIELHHDRKLDSPSGTAIMTAQKIADARQTPPVKEPAKTIAKITGARGAQLDGIHIHSVRLPGYVAHQEVIFGGVGQTLTIRHDSIDRRSFMPGVILAVRRIGDLKGLVVGLDALL